VVGASCVVAVQEEIIELESAKRRLRRRVNQLHTDEQLLARRLDQLRPRDAGTVKRLTSQSVNQFIGS